MSKQPRTRRRQTNPSFHLGACKQVLTYYSSTQHGGALVSAVFFFLSMFEQVHLLRGSTYQVLASRSIIGQSGDHCNIPSKRGRRNTYCLFQACADSALVSLMLAILVKLQRYVRPIVLHQPLCNVTDLDKLHLHICLVFPSIHVSMDLLSRLFFLHATYTFCNAICAFVNGCAYYELGC